MITTNKPDNTVQAPMTDADIERIDEEVMQAMRNGNERRGYCVSFARAIERHLSADTAATRAPMTDAACHEILLAMKEHLQKWTDAQDLDDCDEDNWPAFSGECIRFIAAHLSADTAAKKEGE